jgi:hypothetical protein
MLNKISNLLWLQIYSYFCALQYCDIFVACTVKSSTSSLLCRPIYSYHQLFENCLVIRACNRYDLVENQNYSVPGHFAPQKSQFGTIDTERSQGRIHGEDERDASPTGQGKFFGWQYSAPRKEGRRKEGRSGKVEGKVGPQWRIQDLSVANEYFTSPPSLLPPRLPPRLLPSLSLTFRSPLISSLLFLFIPNSSLVSLPFSSRSGV